MPEFRQTKGLIVLLDALGVRNAGIEETKQFLEREKFLRDLDTQTLGHLLSGEPGSLGMQPGLFTLGDTFLFVFEWAPKEEDFVSKLYYLTNWAAGFVIPVALSHRLRLRGAMSWGISLSGRAIGRQWWVLPSRM